MRVLACVPLIIVTTFAPVLATELAPADLASLLDEVDAANPEVLALAARAQAASEVPGQLEALPDPKLSVSYTNDGLDQITLGSSIMSNLALAWEQTVPYRSVRARAADVGRADAEVAQRTTATVRARVRARVIGLFADLYRLDRSIDIVGESRALLLAAYETAQARYESGEGIQEGLLRAQTEIRRLDLESETLGRERRTVEIAMEAALGRREDRGIGRVAVLPEGELPPDVEALAMSAEATSPEVREAQARSVRAESMVANAKVQTKPEFSWLVAYQYRGEIDPMVTGGFGVRLPVWKDRKQARGIVQSQSEFEAAQRDADSAVLRAREEALSYANDVASDERSLQLYREAILPQGSATLEAARAAFSTGRADMALFLDDFRRLLNDRKEAIALEARRVQALASLEAITAVPLLDVTASGRHR